MLAEIASLAQEARRTSQDLATRTVEWEVGRELGKVCCEPD